MQCLFKAISLTGIELLFLQTLGFPRKKFYHEENILENQIINSSLHFCHARFLKSTNFTLSSLVLALFLSSNMAYAKDPLYSETCVHHEARTFGEKSTAFGECSLAAGDGATALGASTDASPTNTAVGFHAHATFDQIYEHHNENSTAVGFNSNAHLANSTAVGMESQSYGFNSTSVGQQAKAHANNSTAVGQNTLASKTGSTAIGINAKSINVNSVALGTDSVTDHDNQVSIGQKITDATTGAVSYITRTLSNLTDGTDAHDAVNKGQLDKAIASISGGVSAADAQKMADTAQSDAVTTANEHTDTEISKVLNSGSSTTKNAFAIGQDATANGEISTAAGQNAQAKGKNSVALGANSVADKDNQVSIGQKITDATTGAVSYITRTFSNLTDGTDAHDAVNKGQLDTAKSDAISTANQYTDSSITGLKLDEKLSTADSNAQKYATTAQTAANKYTYDTVSKVNEKALKEANTYTDDTAKKTLKTASENTERRALIAENNAVTRSNTYTDESSSRTLESANTYTNHRAAQAENNAVARSNNYTDNRFGELKNQVDRNEKRANGGIAGAMAMTAIPSVPGHNFSFGMAASGYRDQGAIAAGVKANITQDTTVSLNTAWDSGNGVGVAAGFSVGW
ncbi:hypothetical protein DNW23_16020 [Salmonella enterica subsp. enterica serovar Sandiego]|nr:hypothetical protein [Salmonella enterica subsp. enterica serovar Sandiego]